MSLRRPLTVVAGKGGVGRSTVAAALARNAAADGQRVLAVDAINDGGLAAALSAADAESGSTPRAELAGSIELLGLDTERALDEYVRLFLKSPIPPTRIAPIARIFDYVATAAPGVREILAIGKIGHEVRTKAWDLVVVDAPATGHVIELLAAPDTLGELIPVGPLADQTAWLSALLGDPEITGVVAVTLAEELPVTETLDLLSRLDRETNVDLAGVVVNRVPTLLAPEVAEAARALAGAPDGPEDDAAPSPGLALAATIVADRSDTAIDQLDRMAMLEVDLTWIEESPAPVASAQQAFRDIESEI